jgi:putative Ca2+/H+ antiporter (TMEM165/GDT1 family)
MRAYAIVFLSVFLAEIGDKTQLATVLFATDHELSRAGVLGAAAGALMTSTVIAVLAGSLIGAWVEPHRLRKLAALGFIVIGAVMLVRG